MFTQVHHNSSRFKSTQVHIPLSGQVKSSWMCSSWPSTWGHFSLKLGQVSVPQWLPGLVELEANLVVVSFWHK